MLFLPLLRIVFNFYVELCMKTYQLSFGYLSKIIRQFHVACACFVKLTSSAALDKHFRFTGSSSFMLKLDSCISLFRVPYYRTILRVPFYLPCHFSCPACTVPFSVSSRLPFVYALASFVMVNAVRLPHTSRGNPQNQT